MFVRDGAALFVDAAGRRAGPTQAALVRGGDVLLLSVPVGRDAAQTVFPRGRALLAWDLDPTSGGVTALLRGVRDTDAWRWERFEAPAGSRRGLITPEGLAIVAGETVATLAVSDGGDFRPARSPVDGAPEAVALDLDGPWFCAGPWCRLGSTLTWTSVGAGDRWLARRDPPPEVARARAPERVVFDCHPAAAPLPGVEMDRGAAASGYGLVATRRGDALSLRWYGATLQGSASLRWPGPAGALFRAAGVLDARTPAALLERCGDDHSCERAFATSRALVPLALPRTLPGAATAHATDDGWIVRVDHPRAAVGAVTLAQLSPDGATRATRTFTFAPANAPVAAGTLRGATGLWIATGEGALRFHPMTGGAPVEIDDAREGCPAGAVAEGELRRTTDAAAVRGEGWSVDPDEWQVEERSLVVDGRVCVASVSGGEPRDEAEPDSAREGVAVRTFILSTLGPTTATARAWAGHAMIPQRCALTHGR
ncbi:MAG: hypothetical protein R3A52_15775 [Polyangiales bacterium]